MILNHDLAQLASDDSHEFHWYFLDVLTDYKQLCRPNVDLICGAFIHIFNMCEVYDQFIKI